jgi:hypothetical protein
MLLGETATVYSENHTKHRYTVRTECGVLQYIHIQFVPHRKRITSLLQTPASYCCLGKQSLFIVRTIRNTQIHSGGRMQSSAIYTNPVRTSQETHHVSATEPNLLALFGETVAIYCENHTEDRTLCGMNAEFCNIYNSSSYLTGNASRFCYRAQPVTVVWRNCCCSL